jgi:hypothetical protein
VNKLSLIIGVALSPLIFPFGHVLAQDAEEKSDFNIEVSGNFRGDYRFFPDDALYAGQHGEYFSSLFQPEISADWKKGSRLFQFTGFTRLDQYDNERTHADVRELYWQAIFKKWEVSVGVKKIFWGVTESNHLVDIINQADALEGFDLEQKLGQPMVHLSFSPKWGTVDLYGMTYFREMKFPGAEGRLRPPFDTKDLDATYESEMEEYNPDLAIRWSHSIGVFDIGVSHFYGTSRLPLLQSTDGFNFNPHYELIHQSGIDLQAATGSILWKTEIIHRESKRKTITALTVGGEYTFSNIFRTGADIGLIAEYNYDDRGVESINALDDDFFFGTRVGLNDRQSTDLLGGIVLDRENKTLRYFVEANRRLGDSWKLSVEASGFENIDESEFLYLIRNDGFVQVSLAKYF